MTRAPPARRGAGQEPEFQKSRDSWAGDWRGPKPQGLPGRMWGCGGSASLRAAEGGSPGRPAKLPEAPGRPPPPTRGHLSTAESGGERVLEARPQGPPGAQAGGALTRRHGCPPCPARCCVSGACRAHLPHTHCSLRRLQPNSQASLGAAFSTRPSPTLSLSGTFPVLRGLLSLHSIHFSLPTPSTAHPSSGCRSYLHCSTFTAITAGGPASPVPGIPAGGLPPDTFLPSSHTRTACIYHTHHRHTAHRHTIYIYISPTPHTLHTNQHTPHTHATYTHFPTYTHTVVSFSTWASSRLFLQPESDRVSTVMGSSPLRHLQQSFLHGLQVAET